MILYLVIYDDVFLASNYLNPLAINPFMNEL